MPAHVMRQATVSIDEEGGRSGPRNVLPFRHGIPLVRTSRRTPRPIEVPLLFSLILDFSTQPPAPSPQPQPVVVGPYMSNFELFYYLITGNYYLATSYK